MALCRWVRVWRLSNRLASSARRFQQFVRFTIQNNNCRIPRCTRLVSAGYPLKRWVLFITYEGERDDQSRRSIIGVDFTVDRLYWIDILLHWRKLIYEYAAAIAGLVTFPHNVMYRSLLEPKDAVWPTRGSGEDTNDSLSADGSIGKQPFSNYIIGPIRRSF